MVTDVDVIVIGGGPVGLSLAIELGTRSVRTLLVEPRLEVDRSIPRARLVNPRTTGILRRWGLSEQLKNQAEFPVTFPNDVVFVTSMSGCEILRVDDAYFASSRPTTFVEGSVTAHQYQLESVLRDRVADLESVTTWFGSRMTDIQLESDGATVTVTVGQPEGTTVVRARYAIGADGTGSESRARAGIRLHGEGKLANNAQLVFRCHGLWEKSGKKLGMMFWILNETVQSFLLPFSATDDTFILSLYHVDSAELTPETCRRLIQGALGDLDAEFELVHISPWVTYSLLAERYSQDTLYLAGDAAHLHPTYGGHGMNLGVGDATNLGWKLAGVIAGWAPAELLESYEIERRPVAERIILEATEEFRITPRELLRPNLDAAGRIGDMARANLRDEIEKNKKKQFRAIGTQLGYHYQGSPIVVPDGTVPPEWTTNTYVPSASPGALAPHVWLEDGAALYDRCGPDFTVLCLSDDQSAAAEMLEAAHSLGIPCVLVVEQSAELRQLYSEPYVVIRPDLHIAWRGAKMQDDPRAVWRRIVGYDPMRTGSSDRFAVEAHDR